MDSSIQQGYRTAFAQLAEALSACDPQLCARLSGGRYHSEQRCVTLEYLRQPYSVDWPSGSVRHAVSGVEAAPALSVLLLNYLMYANGQHQRGSLIAFRDIPGAANYQGPFHQRAIRPLVQTFDAKGEVLLAAAASLGGSPAEIADTSVLLPILPLLSVCYAIWHGDDEFPASGTILFDASVRKLLPPECLVVAASNGVYALMKAAASRK